MFDDCNDENGNDDGGCCQSGWCDCTGTVALCAGPDAADCASPSDVSVDAAAADDICVCDNEGGVGGGECDTGGGSDGISEL